MVGKFRNKSQEGPIILDTELSDWANALTILQ